MDCDAREHNTITNKNDQKKERITASWIVPNNFQEKKSVKFYYTVVEEESKFWVKQESPEIYIINSSTSFKASLLIVTFFALIMNFL